MALSDYQSSTFGVIKVPQNTTQAVLFTVRRLTNPNVEYHPVHNPMVPENIQGWEFEFRAAKDLATPSFIVKTVGEGIELTNPFQGEFTVTFSPEDTEEVEFSSDPTIRLWKGVWDLYATNVEETPGRYRLFYGQFEISREVEAAE